VDAADALAAALVALEAALVSDVAALDALVAAAVASDETLASLAAALDALVAAADALAAASFAFVVAV